MCTYPLSPEDLEIPFSRLLKNQRVFLEGFWYSPKQSCINKKFDFQEKPFGFPPVLKISLPIRDKYPPKIDFSETLYACNQLFWMHRKICRNHCFLILTYHFYPSRPEQRDTKPFSFAPDPIFSSVILAVGIELNITNT